MPHTLEMDSPRTQEAMRILGVLPAEISDRPLSSFAEEHLLMDFQVQRMEAYDRKREVLMHEISLTREKLIENSRREAMRKAMQKSGAATDYQERNTAGDIIAREQARLKKLEEAQKLEFQQFLEFEIKMQEIAVANEAKRYRENMIEETRQREKAERAREWERQRKTKEEQRYQDELQELKRQEEVAQKQFVEAQRLKEKDQAEQRRRRAIAVKKEMERRRRQEEREVQLLKMQEEQEQIAHERELTLEQREAERMAVLAKRREEETEQHRLQSEALKQRVLNVKEKERASIEAKKVLFEKRAAKVERRRAKFETARNAEIQKSLEESQNHMKKIHAALKANSEKYEMRKRAFADKELKLQQRQIELHRQREREAQRIKEHERMQRMDRIEAIQRQQRAHDYKCKKVQEQIDAENKITERMKEKAVKIIAERRRLAMDARRQKENLSHKVEAIKMAGQFNPQTLMREFGLKMPEKIEKPLRHAPLHHIKTTVKISEPGYEESDEEISQPTRRRHLARLKHNSSTVAVQSSPKVVLRTSSSANLKIMQHSQSAPKIGPISETGYKRLIECGYAYDVDMSWLRKPVRKAPICDPDELEGFRTQNNRKYKPYI
uniref:Uncharacterized protein n=1 Tax=Spongospora subterranea TaxID=70186 RepID=A0A0H5QKJ4_9EUKA|eukprot:CRZ02665.1 hypothetical protein [Spongospora subterranea]